MEPLWCVCPEQLDLFEEDLMDVAHVPTRVSGVTDVGGTKVEFDYVACLVCPRVVHSLLGEVAAPWDRAHQVVPDSSNVRR